MQVAYYQGQYPKVCTQAKGCAFSAYGNTVNLTVKLKTRVLDGTVNLLEDAHTVLAATPGISGCSSPLPSSSHGFLTKRREY